MDFLETLYYDLQAEAEPDTPEYRENRKIRHLLLDDVQKAMGEDMAEKVTAVYTDRENLENYRYFLYGLRLGLELLCL